MTTPTPNTPIGYACAICHAPTVAEQRTLFAACPLSWRGRVRELVHLWRHKQACYQRWLARHTPKKPEPPRPTPVPRYTPPRPLTPDQQVRAREHLTQIRQTLGGIQ